MMDLIDAFQNGPMLSPAKDTDVDVLGCVNALSDRGVDGESLVRYGLGFNVVAPVAVSLAVEQIFGEGMGSVPDTKRWRSVLNLDTVLTAGTAGSRPAPNHEIGRLVGKVIPTLLRWVHWAPITDILSLTPPSTEQIEDLSSSTEPDVNVVEQYMWLVDRWTEPRLAAWYPKSIEYEFRWLREVAVNPCPIELMTERSISIDEIAIEYTERNLMRGDMEGLVQRHQLRVQAQVHAEAFLRDQRYTDAAALFEFMGGQFDEPDANCLNNQGFCLIPESPRRALHYIEAGVDRGYDVPSVSAYNKMCCHVILGNSLDARQVADFYWSEEFDDEPQGATLWQRRGDQWVLVWVDDTRLAVAEFAIKLAQDEGWPARVQRWTKRIEALSRGEHFT
ncbi:MULTISPECIES: hypothetical protein [Nocardiaceae]|uniref:hypothetical protein n=1 Tax=Nocardiaceae TaxID=85025 RepID=UPI00113FE128|nr:MULTISPECIES: hypothetical protein [Rhodococcus]